VQISWKLTDLKWRFTWFRYGTTWAVRSRHRDPAEIEFLPRKSHAKYRYVSDLP